MIQSGDTLCLSFETPCGSFVIRPDKHRDGIFNLMLDQGDSNPMPLGPYCSISDAFNAVSRQETGHTEWDQLPSAELPYRVHNIACWKFKQNLGTFPQAMCS